MNLPYPFQVSNVFSMLKFTNLRGFQSLDLIITYKDIHLKIDFHLGATLLFLHTSFISVPLNILIEILAANNKTYEHLIVTHNL